MTAAMWGAAFAAASVLIGIGLRIVGIMPPLDLASFLTVLAMLALRWGTVGAGVGMVFATAVMLTARKRTFNDLSTSRFTLFGLAAGAIVPIVVSLLMVLQGGGFGGAMQPGLVIAGICGAIGAGVATVTLRLARRSGEPIAPNDSAPARISNA